MGSQVDDNGDILTLLRGPIVVGAVLISVAFSVLQNLSWLSIAQMSILFLGCAVSCYDSASIGRSRFRRYVKTRLEGIVWDDVMYKFFHPDFVWYKYFTETLLGQAAWVYAFPSTPTQRRQLLQSTLNIHDEDEAHRVLFAPGGYKELLLPQSFLRWLENERDSSSTSEGGHSITESSTGKKESCLDIPGHETACGDAGSSSSSVSGQTSEKESTIDFEASEFSLSHNRTTLTTEKLIRKEGKKKTNEGDTHRSQTTNIPTATLPSIKDTMQSIISETISTQLQDFLAYTPNKKQTAALGVLAAASLAVQFRCSKRSRNIALGFLEASSLAGLSAVTMGTGGLLLAKNTFEMGSFQLNARTLVPYIKAALSWKNGVGGGSGTTGKDRWRKACYIAAVVMLVGLRHRRQTSAKR